jgi:virginiamycin B lyase
MPFLRSGARKVTGRERIGGSPPHYDWPLMSGRSGLLAALLLLNHAAAPAVMINVYPVPTPNSALNGICVGPDGRIWFTEVFADKIGAITTEGELSEFALSALSLPDSIIAGSDAALWFTERTGRIGRITTSGTITEFELGAGPRGIALGSDGNLWFTELDGRIGRITPDGGITQFSIPSGDEPWHIAAGPDGNLWFTENVGLAVRSGGGAAAPEQGAIGRITPEGEISEFPVTELQLLGDISSGPDHRLWFTAAGGIGRISTSGVVEEFPFSTADTFGTAIARGPNGDMWFSKLRFVSGGVIQTIDRMKLDGQTEEFPASVAFGTAIVTGLDRNVWFTSGNLGVSQLVVKSRTH